MTIDKTTVDKLAKLSSLKISDENKEKIGQELAEIVEFVENLNGIDVSHVDATFTTIECGQKLRVDTVLKEEGLTERIMANAPKKEDGYFIVPTIIE